MQSPSQGKTYKELLDVTVTPIVMPHHLHSFQVTQVVPYLQDLAKDPKEQYMDSYAELCWEHQAEFRADDGTSEDAFEAKWAGMIQEKFPSIGKDTILSLYQSDDSHNTNMRVRGTWKYGMEKGIAGVPTAFTNGVRITDIPKTTEEW